MRSVFAKYTKCGCNCNRCSNSKSRSAMPKCALLSSGFMMVGEASGLVKKHSRQKFWRYTSGTNWPQKHLCVPVKVIRNGFPINPFIINRSIPKGKEYRIVGPYCVVIFLNGPVKCIFSANFNSVKVAHKRPTS